MAGTYSITSQTMMVGLYLKGKGHYHDKQ